MATYKVLQDIEAEDHILGPLTLRQFIFGLITAFLLWLCFIVVTKGVGFLLALFLPPAIFTGFFALPLGRDQPTEVWALAKIRFFIKPRRRIWDQSGIKELVTITVPKRVEVVRTNGLSQFEVQSRLSALANTIDSRGWAIKNVNVNMYSQPSQLATGEATDRLIDVSTMPQAVPDSDIQASDDMLDERSNPIAQQFDQMINASSQAHRKQIIDTMNDVISEVGQQRPPAPENYWFLNQTPTPPPDGQAVFAQAQVVQPGMPADDSASAPTTPDEAELLKHLKAQNNTPQAYNAHMKTIQPMSAQSASNTPVNAPAQPAATEPPKSMTPPPDPAILNLASNNDLNVATLAREAHKAKNPEPPQDEVVISLR